MECRCVHKPLPGLRVYERGLLHRGEGHLPHWPTGSVANFLWNFETQVLFVLAISMLVPNVTRDVLLVTVLATTLFVDGYLVNFPLRHLVSVYGPQGDTCYYGYQMPYYVSEQVGVLVFFALMTAIRYKHTPSFLGMLFKMSVGSLFIIAPVYRNTAYTDQVFSGFLVGLIVAVVGHTLTIWALAMGRRNIILTKALECMGVVNEYAPVAWTTLVTTSALYPRGEEAV